MRIRLIYKMMASFITIVVLAAIVTAVAVNFSTTRAFRAMVRESDIAYAQELAILLGIYHEETGGWEKVGDLLLPPSQMGMQGSGMRRFRMNNSDLPSLNNMTRMGPQKETPVVLKDKTGRIVFSNMNFKEPMQFADDGIDIYDSKNVLLGSVYSGSMIGAELLPIQNAFLLSVRKAILFASLLVGLATFVMAWFFVKHITDPVSTLQKASLSIRNGNLNVRVDINRNDELGDLASGFNSMTESLLISENWKRQIIADSAHELRTPVSLIQGHLEMILEGVYPADLAGIKMIHDETVRLGALISELQELSSAEAGQISYNIEPLRIDDLILTGAANLKAGYAAKGVLLSTEITDNIPMIRGDRQKLLQVLVNVLSNSLKFTPRGGTVNIYAGLIDDLNVFIDVEDSGSGIPLSEREKIFERFYRINKERSRVQGGSGLGLAISREIVSSHGGSIKAIEPLNGTGARIRLSLPAV